MNGKKDDKHKRTYCTVLNHAEILAEVDNRMKDGNIKYGDNNWQHLDECRIKEALARHLMAYLDGEMVDPECKSHTTHLSAIISNAMFLHYFYKKKLKLRYESYASNNNKEIKKVNPEPRGYWHARSRIASPIEYNNQTTSKFYGESIIGDNDDNEGNETD